MRKPGRQENERSRALGERAVQAREIVAVVGVCRPRKNQTCPCRGTAVLRLERAHRDFRPAAWESRWLRVLDCAMISAGFIQNPRRVPDSWLSELARRGMSRWERRFLNNSPSSMSRVSRRQLPASFSGSNSLPRTIDVCARSRRRPRRGRSAPPSVTSWTSTSESEPCLPSFNLGHVRSPTDRPDAGRSGNDPRARDQ